MRDRRGGELAHYLLSQLCHAVRFCIILGPPLKLLTEPLHPSVQGGQARFRAFGSLRILRLDPPEMHLSDGQALKEF